MTVRKMLVEDIQQVAEVEEECFPRPWNQEALYRDYAQNPSSYFYVMEDDNSIVGHLGLWRRDDHVHVTTLAVRSDHRRQGVGTSLINRVREDFPDRDITLEVRKSNDTAQQFYKKLGFQVTGRRPDYYTNNGEDAIVMSLSSSSNREAI
ncbi:MAG: ribosomal protein S18-alanine N-acetyltransferase [bacterium]